MPRKPFFPPGPIIPSYEHKTPWLYAYPPSEGDAERSQDEETSSDSDIGHDTDKCGKWMLFLDNTEVILERGMTHHDYAWQFIKKLVEESKNCGLFCVDCSTSYVGPEYERDPNSTNGVICCFVKDYTDKKAVKMAADAIRRVVDYPKPMYFKTDEATRAGKFRHLGHQYISIYKHTYGKRMFERSKEDPRIWNLVKI